MSFTFASNRVTRMFSECSCFVFQNHTDLEQHEEMTEMSFWVNYPFKLHACLIKKRYLCF